MEKKLFLFGMFFLIIISAHSQVGLNTETPKATLHILPQKTDANTPEGIIAPALTRMQLISKDNAYNMEQKGAIVYVSDLSGTLTAKTEQILNIGYYYFDGNIWQHFVSSAAGVPTEPWSVQGTESQATDIDQNIYHTGSVGVGSEGVIPADYKLQVTGNQYITGNGKMGGSSTYNSSAQLELGDTNKGFLPNRVALTSAGAKDPLDSVVEGILVYNTTTSEPADLYPGYYFWMNNRWNRLQNEKPKNTVSLLNLESNVTTTVGNISTLAASGAVLPLGIADGNGVYSIEIPDDGVYAFNVRLYGYVKDSSGTGNVKDSRTVIYYVGLLNNNTMVDAAEINVSIIPTTNISTVATYSLVMTCEAKAGDKITFKMNHFSNTPYPWLLNSVKSNIGANRTSMVWWKL